MITEFKDIDYTVNMTIGKSNDCYVDFEAYEIVGYDELKQPSYQILDSKSSNDYTEISNNAEWIVRGSIKWDACAHFEFNNYVHLCGPTDAKNLGILITRLFDLACEMIPTADEGMFEKQFGDR